MKRSDVINISKLLDRDEMINDFDFNRILIHKEYTIRPISAGKKGKKTMVPTCKISYSAAW